MLVWIHGGRFASGGAAKYGYKMLAENFVSKGIVVVTIQYRLASFGKYQKKLNKSPLGGGLR